MALLYGMADPLALLRTDGAEWEAAVAVVNRAQALYAERRVEELKPLIDAIGRSVGNRVGEILVQAFRAMAPR